MPPFFLPVRIKRTKKCERCGCRYPKVEENCSHCSNLKDGAELNEFLSLRKRRMKANVNLGKLFLYISLLLALILILVMF